MSGTKLAPPKVTFGIKKWFMYIFRLSKNEPPIQESTLLKLLKHDRIPIQKILYADINAPAAEVMYYVLTKEYGMFKFMCGKFPKRFSINDTFKLCRFYTGTSHILFVANGPMLMFHDVGMIYSLEECTAEELMEVLL